MVSEEHEQTINTEHYEMNSILTLEEKVCGPLERTTRAYDYEF